MASFILCWTKLEPQLKSTNDFIRELKSGLGALDIKRRYSTQRQVYFLVWYAPSEIRIKIVMNIVVTIIQKCSSSKNFHNHDYRHDNNFSNDHKNRKIVLINHNLRGNLDLGNRAGVVFRKHV